ncbi:MAG TPA: type II secretion system F family protein [Acidimicrobiales bacterium]
MTVVAALLVVATALAARAAVAATRGALVRRRFGSPLPSAGRPGRLAVMVPDPPPWVEPALDAAGIDLAPAAAWWGWTGAVAAGAALGLMAGGVALALLAAALLTAGPAVVVRSRRGRGDERLEGVLPAALEAVARALRSGASLRQAVAEAAGATPGRLGRELDVVAAQVERGAMLLDALEALAVRRPLPGVRLAVAALCLGVETGGAQARAVDGVATTLRDRMAVAAEVRALSSQARVSAVVIGLAPVAFGGFAATTDPRTAQFMFHTPAGLMLLAVGVILDGLGWLWMQRLARVPA